MTTMTSQPSLAPLLVTIRAAAKILALGESTVYAMVASGELPHVAVGRAKRITITAIEEWIARNTVRAGA
jgi:excisionase family DNA binding protein